MIALQRPLEQWRCDEQRNDPEGEEEEDIGINGGEASVFEQNRLKSVNGIGEWVDICDDAQPGWKAGDG